MQYYVYEWPDKVLKGKFEWGRGVAAKCAIRRHNIGQSLTTLYEVRATVFCRTVWWGYTSLRELHHIAFQGINRCCLHLSPQSASVPFSHPPSCLFACTLFTTLTLILPFWQCDAWLRVLFHCICCHLTSSRSLSPFFSPPLFSVFFFFSLTHSQMAALFAIWRVMILALPRCW